MSAWGQLGDVVEQAFESSHIRPPPNPPPPFFRVPFFFPMFRSVVRLVQARGLTYACYSVLHFLGGVGGNCCCFCFKNICYIDNFVCYHDSFYALSTQFYVRVSAFIRVYVIVIVLLVIACQID
jgi:hypothetical protein